MSYTPCGEWAPERHTLGSLPGPLSLGHRLAKRPGLLMDPGFVSCEIQTQHCMGLQQASHRELSAAVKVKKKDTNGLLCEYDKEKTHIYILTLYDQNQYVPDF